MNKILIKNANIVNHDNSFIADLFIENGIIAKIGSGISQNADIVIDAKGKYLFPGGIDTHVHFALPSAVGITADDFYSGSKAALYGGTTSVIDFITTEKGQNYFAAIEKRIRESESAKCNVKMHFSPTWWHEKSEIEIGKIFNDFKINSFKIYMAYKSGIGINDDVLIKIMEAVAKNGGIVTIHAENDELIEYLRKKFINEGKTTPKYHPLSRPDDCEAEAISRAIMYSKFTDCPIYIVHVSSKKGIEVIENAQKQGIKVFAETCPQYLVLDDSVFESDFETAAKYVLSPPIRKKTDNEALWNAIKNGVIQTIGTDHCSFNIKGQKDFGRNNFTKIPNGAGGVEHRLELIYTFGVMQNKISINKLVEICCYNPAKIFNLNNKGVIAEGYDADLVIWNSDFEHVISAKNHIQKCDNNIYESFVVKGKAEVIILNGKIINI